MNDSASMAPGTKRGTTEIVMKLGELFAGVHPWSIHFRQCGADEGVFGALDNYSPLSINSKGTVVLSATVALNTRTAGNYFVSVQASPSNRELTVGWIKPIHSGLQRSVSPLFNHGDRNESALARSILMANGHVR